MQHVFGPVSSRRLKRSLGVDLIPFKTCSFDCIYCEVGKTTHLTVKRDEYIPCEAILADVEAYLHELTSPPDYITLGGSGEPTLHSKIGTIISEIKRMTTIPVAVLTNGSLLYQDEVGAALKNADVVLPSLDAAGDEVFHRICRPHPSLELETLIQGLKTFRSSYKGEVWLEILLCRGINDSPDEIARLKDIVGRIDPHKIQLNTVDRPPPEAAVFPLTGRELGEIQRVFGLKAEIVAKAGDEVAGTESLNGTLRIMEHLKRRPGTSEDLSKALRLANDEVTAIIETLEKEGIIQKRLFDGRWYYLIT